MVKHILWGAVAAALVCASAPVAAEPEPEAEAEAAAAALSLRVTEILAAKGVRPVEQGRRIEIRKGKGEVAIAVVDVASGTELARQSVVDLPADREAAAALVASLAASMLAELGAPPPPSWSNTFAAAKLVAHHEPESILVVGAGDRAPSLDAAAKALADGYRAAGVSLVMDASGLGDVSALDDGEIAKRAAGLPVADVAILRIFAGASGQPPRAVVTIYRVDGELVTAFSTVAGEALPAPAAAVSESVAVGVSAKVVDRVMTGGDEIKTDAQIEYERKSVQFDDVYVGHGWFVRRIGVAYQGEQRRPLEGAEFYEAIGRDDLASSYRRRRKVRIGAGVLTGVSLAAGLVFFVAAETIDPLTSDCSYDDDQCMAEWRAGASERERRAAPYETASGASLCVSIAAGLFTWLYSSHPIEEAEARTLADGYNQSLRKRLGLKGEQAVEETSARHSVQVSPYATLDGGGLRVFGRF